MIRINREITLDRLRAVPPTHMTQRQARQPHIIRRDAFNRECSAFKNKDFPLGRGAFDSDARRTIFNNKYIHGRNVMRSKPADADGLERERARTRRIKTGLLHRIAPRDRRADGDRGTGMLDPFKFNSGARAKGQC